MKKTFAVIAISLVAVFTLAGCSGPENDEPKPPAQPTLENYAPDTIAFEQELPDGRTVLCVWADGFKKGGLSCDWDGAK